MTQMSLSLSKDLGVHSEGNSNDLLDVFVQSSHAVASPIECTLPLEENVSVLFELRHQPIAETLDMNALLFDSNQQLLPNASERVLDAFLKLTSPRVDANVIDFFNVPEFLELLMNRVTQSVSRVARDPEWINVADEELILPLRTHNAHDPVWESSLKVVKFLVSDLEENKTWVANHRLAILTQLCRIFDPESEGGFRHFRQIFITLIQRHVDLCDFMIQETHPQLGQPMFFHMIRFAQDPNIADCILALIFRYVLSETRESRQDRFYQLSGVEFMGTLLSLLVNKEHSEAYQGDSTRTATHVTLAISELVVRITRESASTPDAHILFLNFMGDLPHVLAALIQCVSQGQRLGLEVLHAMITSVDSKNGLGYDGWIPIQEPKQTCIRLLRPYLSAFCHHHLELADRVTTKIMVLEILLTIVKSTRYAEELASICANIPWKVLSHGFFSRHKNNNIYHSRVYGILSYLLEHGSDNTLKDILEKSEWIQETVDHYHGDQANRGFILLLCEQLRHHPSLQIQNSEWTRIQSLVESDLQRQKASLFPKPPPRLVAAQNETLPPVPGTNVETRL